MKEGLLYTILLGGNEGDTHLVFEAAKAKIAKEVGELKIVSSLYVSPPWGFEAEQDFLNQVIVVKSAFPPKDVMERLLSIESVLGRTRSEVKGYASRVIDLDVLFQEGAVLFSEIVELPHPRLHERRFTLLPLAEIMPDFIHPILNKAMVELVAECGDTSVVFVKE